MTRSICPSINESLRQSANSPTKKRNPHATKEKHNFRGIEEHVTCVWEKKQAKARQAKASQGKPSKASQPSQPRSQASKPASQHYLHTLHSCAPGCPPPTGLHLCHLDFGLLSRFPTCARQKQKDLLIPWCHPIECLVWEKTIKNYKKQ